MTAIRVNYCRNTACYRVGWVLARQLSSILHSFLQSIPAFPASRALDSPSQGSISLSKAGNSPLKPMELSITRRSEPSLAARNLKRTTLIISQLVVNKPILRKLAGLLLATAFERLKVVNLRGNTRESGREYSSGSDYESGSRHTGDVAKKTAELSQRVASIMQLIDAKRAETSSSEPVSSRSSLLNTPKRPLNLRIPNQSSISTSRLSPGSPVDMDSEEGVSPEQNKDSISADLTQLKRKEKALRVWKGWKVVVMQGKMRKLKVEIGQKGRNNRICRRVMAALVKWTNYKRSKHQWGAIAVHFNQKTILSLSFRKLKSVTSRTHLFTLASQHHSQRSLHRLITLWAHYSKVKSLRKAKVSTVLDRVEDRIRYKFIAIWKLASKISLKSRKKKEKALFFWYENTIPKIWKELRKAVQMRAIKGKMRKIAEKMRGTLLLRTSFPLWRAAVLQIVKNKRKEAKLGGILAIKSAHFALKRLFEYAERHKMRQKGIEIAENCYKIASKYKTFVRFKRVIHLSQGCKALHTRITQTASSQLLQKALKCWKITVRRKMYETNYIETSKNKRKIANMRKFLLQWGKTMKDLQSKRNIFAKRRRINALRSTFQSLTTALKADISKKELLSRCLAAMQGTTLVRLVSAWRQIVEKKRKYRKEKGIARWFYLGKRYDGWRDRYRKVAAVRLLIRRRLQRDNWNLWVDVTKELTTEERVRSRAERHYRLRVLRSIWEILAKRHSLARKFAYIREQMRCLTRENGLKGWLQAWIKAVPVLKRRSRVKQLAASFAATRFQLFTSKIASVYLRFLRKSRSLRKKISVFQRKSALVAFQNAISDAQIIRKTHKNLLSRANIHLKSARLHEGLSRLSVKISLKQHLASLILSFGLEKAKIAIQRWQSYHQRYTVLMLRAEDYRLERDRKLAGEALKSLKMACKSRGEEERLGLISQEYRIGRVITAWKRATLCAKEENSAILAMRRGIILKACLKTIAHNCRLLRTLKLFLSSKGSTSDAKLKALSLLSFKRYTALQRSFRAIQSQHTALTLHSLLLSWRNIAQTNKHKEIALAARLKHWFSYKRYESAMAYVQPRLREGIGRKLTALWKWKLISQPSHPFMALLMQKNTRERPISRLAMLFGQWRGASLLMHMYRNLLLTLFRKRKIQIRAWKGWKTGVIVCKLRRKKCRTADIFSRLKRKMRYFQGWKWVKCSSKMPRSRSASGRKGVPTPTKVR